MSLDRFLEAQDRIWPVPLRELTAGRKQSHWMWFVFPQLRGLGRSATAEFYGIADLAEAGRYLAHPVLGRRLIETSEAMLPHRHLGAVAVLDPVDAMKLRSSMTLFAALPEVPGIFSEVLDAFHDGRRCEATLRALAG